jgi:NAD-dependent dihydropyrimidine dehydrogenase PreA subunit
MSELFNDSGHQYAEIIDIDQCTSCALCCQICPDIAIEIEDAGPTSKDKKTKAKKGVKI